MLVEYCSKYSRNTERLIDEFSDLIKQSFEIL